MVSPAYLLGDFVHKNWKKDLELGSFHSALQLPDDDNLGPGSRVRNGVQKASGNPVAEWEQARAV